MHRYRYLSNAYPTLTLHIYSSDLTVFTVWEADGHGRLATRRMVAAVDKPLLS